MSPRCTSTAYGQLSTSRTSEQHWIASLAKLARRGSRCEAAAFLTRSPTKNVSARSLVQDSGARSEFQLSEMRSAMKKFHRRRGMIVTQLSAYEVELLASLIMQLIELISDGEPEGFATESKANDPFEEIVKDLEGEPDEPGPLEDPVLRRLFPDAYPDDPAASADFRRFTERDLKAAKVTEARVVLNRLATTELGARDLKIPRDEVESWLRTLTSVRLAVATRLGIKDAAAADELAALPDEDPRTFMVSVYDWLGFAQETLINAL
jgi:Domain of unknown function (DUF2017)